MSDILLVEQATPTTPNTAQGLVYFKSDHLLYYVAQDGTERKVATAASALTATTFTNTGLATFATTSGIVTIKAAGSSVAWGSNYNALNIGTFGAIANDVAATAVVHLANNAYNDNTNWRYGQGPANPAGLYTQTLGGHKFQIAAAGAAGNTITWTDALTISTAAAVTIPGHVAGTPTWVTGDKYLVVDSSGRIHVSAIGPAS